MRIEREKREGSERWSFEWDRWVDRVLVGALVGVPVGGAWATGLLGQVIHLAH